MIDNVRGKQQAQVAVQDELPHDAADRAADLELLEIDVAIPFRTKLRVEPGGPASGPFGCPIVCLNLGLVRNRRSTPTVSCSFLHSCDSNCSAGDLK